MREVKRITVGPLIFFYDTDENDHVTVIMEAGDYTTPDGFHHVDGVYRVRSKFTKSGKSHKRAKTFKGETAWMRAENEFSDRVYQVQYRRAA